MKYVANPVIVDAWEIESVRFHGGCFELTLKGRDGHVRTDSGMTARMVPKPGDYYVIQSDGYIYLNPKDVFERKYSPDEDGTTVLRFTAAQFKALKNVLVWADLYDCEKNLGKNQAVFEEIRNTFDYTDEGEAAGK